MAHQPGSGRAADMALAAQQQHHHQQATWSSHVHAPTPMPSPASGGGAVPTAAAVEWKLAGFEIHSDGSQNVTRPIYRCPHCKRLCDVDAVASGLAEHTAQCVFTTLLYRSPLQDAAAMQQQQHQLQIQHQMQLTHHHYLAANSDAFHHQQQPHAVGDSPKTLAALISDRQRPVLTISPYMNKVTGSDDDNGSQTTSDASSPAVNAGNLFASNAFRNQMEISEVVSHLGKPETNAHAFLAVDTGDSDDVAPESDHHAGDATSLGLDDSNSTVGVGSALFNEMSSMGISLDQFDKPTAGGFNPLADFGGLGDEDQVFYILARMYTDARNRKLGLPAFDQFQRMVR